MSQQTQIVRPVEPQPFRQKKRLKWRWEPAKGFSAEWKDNVEYDRECPTCGIWHKFNPYPVGSVLCGREVVSVEVRCVDGKWFWFYGLKWRAWEQK